MISLSLCMIVKNEEAVLERILKPVSQVMDAILIADRHGTIEYSAMFSEQENGLADELGTLEAAVAKACELAGIADADTVYLQSSTSDLSRLLDIMGTEDSLDVSGTLKELENRVGLE